MASLLDTRAGEFAGKSVLVTGSTAGIGRSRCVRATRGSLFRALSAVELRQIERATSGRPRSTKERDETPGLQDEEVMNKSHLRRARFIRRLLDYWIHREESETPL